jgi:hypothetical protein
MKAPRWTAASQSPFVCKRMPSPQNASPPGESKCAPQHFRSLPVRSLMKPSVPREWKRPVRWTSAPTCRPLAVIA